MHTVPSWLQTAFAEWLTGRLYVDGRGNYRARVIGHPRHVVSVSVPNSEKNPAAQTEDEDCEQADQEPTEREDVYMPAADYHLKLSQLNPIAARRHVQPSAQACVSAEPRVPPSCAPLAGAVGSGPDGQTRRRAP